MKVQYCLYIALMVISVVGCQPSAGTVTDQPTQSSSPDGDTQTKPTTTLPTQESQKDVTEMTQPAQPTPSFGMQFLIEKAIEDLAQRLSIEMTQISLIEAKEVVWPDSSLGCPQPGMRYKQVPEDGALIILQAQGSVYEYHNGGSRGLFLCEKTYKDPYTPPKIDLNGLTPFLRDNDNPPPLTPDNSILPGEDQ